jgi:hypothetical protein
VNALQKSAVALAGFAALALPSAGVAAPAAKGQTPPPRMMAQHFYAPIFEKERYDSVLSLNDHCPVKHGKLNTNIRPTYINRQPVGFC